MNLRDIVTLFKNHQIQYGLNGDSENQMQELYKYAAKSSKKKSDISTQTAIEVI